MPTPFYISNVFTFLFLYFFDVTSQLQLDLSLRIFLLGVTTTPELEEMALTV